MIRRVIHPILVTLAAGCHPSPEMAWRPPRLLVVIVVDQMRTDYLDRFGPWFTGGLERLLREGAVFRNAVHDHAITSTSPGHATLVTGAYPSHHGIVQNEWYEHAERRFVYSVDDDAYPIVGFPDDSGRSPRRLLRTGLADWLKAQHPRAKVNSVALKDRAAILMGGNDPDGAYWYRRRNGMIVTSTFYRRDYPQWVTDFNRADRPEGYVNRVWNRLLPDSAYRQLREDDFAAEHDGTHITFPHTVAWEGGVGDDWFYRYTLPRTPFADERMLRFAGQLAVHEEMGADATPDILFVSASAGDFVGHEYGPLSHEVQDYYLRLDRSLAELFALLDTRIGPEEYLVALAADHGVMPLPEALERGGVDAGRIEGRTLAETTRRAAEAAAAERGIAPPTVQRDWISVGLAFPAASPQDVHVVRQAVAEALRTLPPVADAFTLDDLLATAEDTTRPFLGMYRRSAHPERTADVTVRLREHYLTTSRTSRTSHGSPYAYDTRVPVIFAGPGIEPGTHDQPIRTVDVAPTLAALLGIPVPPDLDGISLKRLITGRARPAP